MIRRSPGPVPPARGHAVGPAQRIPTRLLSALAVVVAVVVASPGQVGADPARPTNYRSEILAVDPALPEGFTLEVIGGDAFLELEVPDGYRVVVPDYGAAGDGSTPPYLRFGADGTVERNEVSNAAAANESRYGSSDRSPDPGEEPRWEAVATNGRYAWHDHRIHWMLPSEPAATDERGRVDLGGDDGTWTVDLLVNDEPVEVRGELLRLDTPSPAPWVALAVVVLAAPVALTAWSTRTGRRPPHRLLGAALLGAGMWAVAIGWAQWRAVPAGAGGDPLGAVVPGVGTLAAAAVLATRGARSRLLALAVAVAALGGWGAVRYDVLLSAVLPTSLPFAVDRSGTAVALGLAAGVAAVLVWQPPVDRQTG